MKRLFISSGIAILTIPSLCYYIIKYYNNKALNSNRFSIVMFTIICSLTILGLLFGIYNAYKLTKLENIIKDNHYENLEVQMNNREIMLDMENK